MINQILHSRGIPQHVRTYLYIIGKCCLLSNSEYCSPYITFICLKIVLFPEPPAPVLQKWIRISETKSVKKY